jgi:hypothetical protein
MTTPPHWDADSAVAPLPLRPWTGIVWRSHGIDLTGSRRAGTRVYYAPTSDGGSRRTSGRYHRAPDLYPGQQVWPALYTSLTDGGCLAEVIRYTGSLADLATIRMTALRATLAAVLDLRAPSTYGLTIDALITDDYTITQALGLAALRRGAEGILVPAASLLGTNLVILTENLRPGSVVDVLESIDPRLRRPTT